MKKRFISIALIIATIAAMIPAAIIPTAALEPDGYANGYDIYVSDVDPTLDGSMDTIYENSEKIIPKNINTYNATDPAANFEVSMVITKTALYVYADIYDTTVDVEKEQSYVSSKGDTLSEILRMREGDKFQLFLQIANTVGDETTWKYGYFDMDYAHDDIAKFGDFTNISNVSKVSTIDGEKQKYTVELKLPWSSISNDITPETVDVYLGVQVNDYDGYYKDASDTLISQVQHYILYDNPKTGTYWYQKSHYDGETQTNINNGTGYYTYYNIYNGKPLSKMIPANLISVLGTKDNHHDGYDAAVSVDANINVDGVKDAAYSASETAGNGYELGKGDRFEAYTAVTETGLYVFADVYDTDNDGNFTVRIYLGTDYRITSAKTNSKRGYIDIAVENGAATPTVTYGAGYTDAIALDDYKVAKYADGSCGVEFFVNWLAVVNTAVPEASEPAVAAETTEETTSDSSDTSTDTSTDTEEDLETETVVTEVFDFKKLDVYIGFMVNYGHYTAYDKPDTYGFDGSDDETYTKLNFVYDGNRDMNNKYANFPGFSVYKLAVDSKTGEETESIAIDASRDEIYLNSHKITEQQQGDIGFDAYIVAGKNGLYLYIEAEGCSDNAANDKVTLYVSDRNAPSYTIKDANDKDITKSFATKNVNTITIDRSGDGTVDSANVNVNTKSLKDQSGAFYGWVAEVFIPWSTMSNFEDEINEETDKDNSKIKDEDGKYVGPTAPYACSIGMSVTDGTNTCYSNYSRTDWASSGDNTGKSYYVPLAYTDYAPPVHNLFVTNEKIVLDGEAEKSYYQSTMIMDRSHWVNNSTDNPAFKAYYVATLDGLYVWADVDDTTMNNINDDDPETGEMVQIYLDWSRNYVSHEATGLAGYDYRDVVQSSGRFGGWICLDYNGNIKLSRSMTKLDVKSAVVKHKDNADQYVGYAIEAFIPWNDYMKDQIGAHANDIHLGIGIQVSDDAIYDYKKESIVEDPIYKVDDEGNFILNADGNKIDTRTPEQLYGNEYRTGISYDTNSGGSYFSHLDWLPDANIIYAADLPGFSRYVVDKVNDEKKVTVDGKNTAGEYDGASIVYATVGGGGTADDEDTLRVITDGDYIYILIESEDRTPIYSAITSDGQRDYIDLGINFNGRYIFMPTVYRVEDPANPDVGHSGDRNAWSKRWHNACNFYNNTNGEYYGEVACTNTAFRWSYEIQLILTEEEKLAVANGTFTLGIAAQFQDSFYDDNGKPSRNYAYTADHTAVYQGNDITPSEILDFKYFTFADHDTRFCGANVDLGSSIVVNYYAYAPAAAESVVAKFTMNSSVVYVEGIPADLPDDDMVDNGYSSGYYTGADSNQYSKYGRYYVFPFEGVAPQCIKDNVKAELYVNGILVDTKDNYSVNDNLTRVSNDSNEALIDALKNYCAAAQIYADYKLNVYRIVDQTTLDAALAGDSNGTFNITTVREIGANTVTDAKFSALGIYHSSTNSIYVKVKLSSGADVNDLAVTITDDKGNTFEGVMEKYSSDTYIVYSEDIRVLDFDKVYTFTLTSKNGGSQVITYSVNSYCAQKQGNDSSLDSVERLARALYCYGKAAEAAIAGN